MNERIPISAKRIAIQALAIAVIAASALTYYLTIGKPRWWRTIGYNEPVATIEYGDQLKFRDVLWRMHVEDLGPLYAKYSKTVSDDEKPPKNAKVFAVTLDRHRDGKPIVPGTTTRPPALKCHFEAVHDDRGRSWTSSISPTFGVSDYEPSCDKPGIPLAAFFVPEDARISSVDVTFYYEPKEQPLYEAPAQKEVKFRFLVP